MKWLRDIFTELDNETTSIVRVLAIGGVTEYMGAGIVELWRSGHFPFQDFGVGLGATILAVGAAMKLGERKSEEPKP